MCVGTGEGGCVRKSLAQLTGEGSVIAEGNSELFQMAVSIRPTLSCGPSAMLLHCAASRGSEQQKA